MSHAELVERAAKYLKNEGYSTVITSKSIMDAEEPDAIGFKAGGVSMLIECKRTRKDFLKDREKPWRKNPEMGMGYYRAYLTPAFLVVPSELPTGWGLIEVSGRVARLAVECSCSFWPRNVKAELVKVLAHVRKLEGKVRPIRKPGQGPVNAVPVADPGWAIVNAERTEAAASWDDTIERASGIGIA